MDFSRSILTKLCTRTCAQISGNSCAEEMREIAHAIMGQANLRRTRKQLRDRLKLPVRSTCHFNCGPNAYLAARAAVVTSCGDARRGKVCVERQHMVKASHNDNSEQQRENLNCPSTGVCLPRGTACFRRGDQISIISKSSLRAPQSGQVQFMGTSSQRVPGGMPSSGRPFSSS
jgi:hypothetical protein